MGDTGSIEKQETAAEHCVNSFDTMDNSALFVAMNQWKQVNSHLLIIHLKIE